MDSVSSPRQDPASRQTTDDRRRSQTSDENKDRNENASYNFKSHLCGQKLDPTSERIVRLTYLYGGVHGAIDQLLPACFKALERDMGFSPQSLGALSSATRISHVLTCPIWGFIIDCCGRRRIFSSSALGWGAATSALLYITQKWQVLPLMCVLGVFMAAMGPLSQKVIAQEVPENDRGRSFGILHFFQSFGRVLSLTITTSASGLVMWGIEGWRHAMVGFGMISILTGILLGCRITDCPHQRRRQKEKGHWFPLSETAYVFRNGSVWVMLLMGILNGIPRSAIHFSTMYFQYCSIPDWWASFIVSSSWIAAMVVAPVIGCTGDFIHSRYPYHGRQCLAQICIVARCLLMTIMLTCVPREASSLGTFVILAVLMGFLAGWPGVGVNRPILTEIVYPEHRATTFALVSCLEGVGAAALGAPIVGYLCENVFGYVRPPHDGLLAAAPAESVRVGNARAISLAMLCMTVGPWLLTIVAYGVLHLTYKSDSRHGSALAAAGDAESASSPGAGKPQRSETLPLVTK
ncbi:hypothetical protein, conserved [Eimeria necatrix]|uniref:Major facilitator superfamily (MFS) profile domain-containing protein n=1 Tax=Eimeria necatrix TaxID=51315 RepID=U6MRB8_9EIME|nr:hypothetical protein, conserved [Eimeria necatrix]CDJ66536.1 hypothetical protein, conserved [Eimeria necatrix]